MTREAEVGILIGYARCSTDKQDLAAQREILVGLGVILRLALMPDESK